ncbi:hypothetical protein C9374_011387 [Naegleria lovaniensis]|uniref:CCR4-NOT transcription complex subunit 4 n=1 Tax=Naegleria lovaniensis TaxID=51637 RepID=A0AA88KQU3_NAELO|nr:uncharacterized protein C9374_011387 [Naegleria lovaniensis]KAG2392662.1 hypothetical protein C9374_011387 [Naegleria lovaniensis]
MSDYSSDEDTTCPICCEDLDITDKHFQPCPCGFKICSWCWNKIDNSSKRCPACRREYEKSNIEFTPPDPELIQQEKKQKEKKKKPHINRKQLANVRVIQRNLVYVVGLTLSVAKHDWLKHTDNFAKYGKIKKVVINKSNLHNSSHIAPNRTPTVSAYITYVRKEDAYKAIRAVDKTYLDGKQLRASFGTTKYCAYFLKGIACTNPDCMYLHEYGNDEDTFNKDEIVLRNGLPVPHNLEKMSQFYPPDDDSQPIEKHFWKYPNSNREPEDDESNDESESSIGASHSRSNSGIRHYDDDDGIDDDQITEDDDDIQDDEDEEYAEETIVNAGGGVQLARSSRANGSASGSNSRRHDPYHDHTIDDYYYGGDDDDEEVDDDHEVQTEYANITTKVIDNSKESILPKTARWGQQPVLPVTATASSSTTTSNSPLPASLSSLSNIATNITKSKKKNTNKNKKSSKNKNKNKNKSTKAKEAEGSDTAATSSTTNNQDTQNNVTTDAASSGRSSTDHSMEEVTTENQAIIESTQINEEIQPKSELEGLDDSVIETHPTLEMLGIEPNPPSDAVTSSIGRSKLLSLVESSSPANVSTNIKNPFSTDPTQAFSFTQISQPQPQQQQQQQQYFGYPQQVQQLFASFQGYDPYYQQYFDNSWTMSSFADTKRTSSRFFNQTTAETKDTQQQQQFTPQPPQMQPPQAQHFPMNTDMWSMQSVPSYLSNPSSHQSSRFFGGAKQTNNSQPEQNPQVFNNADLQNSFRALLPNVNITFASQNNNTSEASQTSADWGYSKFVNPTPMANESAPIPPSLYSPQYSDFFTQRIPQQQTTNNASWSWK